MVRTRSVFLSTIACVLLAAARVSAGQITLAWDPNTEPNIAGYLVEYGPGSAPFTQRVDVGNTTTWTLAGATAGVTYSFRVIAYNTNSEYSDPSGAILANTDGPVGATLNADRASLAFGIISGAPQTRTAAQSVRLTQSGAGAVSWTASSSAAWLSVSPASGSGSGALTVSVVPGAVPSTNSSATVTIAATGASNTIAPITVSLNVLSQAASNAPAGSVDSPANNATGVTGSMAMTGWAIDDIDIARIQILRDPVAGEGTGLVYVGDGMLVEDARPDIAALYPTLPWSYRAGWGYLLLTNMLPALGNGTFRFWVYAYDPDGHSTLLGMRTVTCTNASATQPFGAIDTPAPGATVAGNNYLNFGWVLSRLRRADPPGGGTVTAFIDGAAIGSPGGWTARTDLTPLFPAYPGIGSAAGVLAFDTTTLANGVHTISWVVTDNMGSAAGIGSRYFRVFNATSSLTASLTASIGLSDRSELAGATADGAAIDARRGYAPDTPFARHEADANGRVTLQTEELDRIELMTHGATEGYLVSGDALRPLPIGSRLDPVSGSFIWQPGIGFVGSYDLAFLRRTSGGLARQDVRIVLNPKGSNRVGPQIVVDVTGEVVAGWAADLDSPIDRGIDVIHVWAYPAGGGHPVFVGEASYGGERPDVAAVYGERFGATGFGIRVHGLEPGTYDLGIFALSSSRHTWFPAKVVRVHVK